MIKAQSFGFLNTPPIWEKKQFDIQQFEFPSLDLQSFHPKPILRNIRFGHQMEEVFKQLIEYSAVYEVVLFNLPVRQGGRTLGEIDFILKNKTKDELIHVELTYKFYIINPEVSESSYRIIGPNKRDMFVLKREKIKHKQFPLLHSEEGAKALADHQIDHLGIVHQVCFKAQLFTPYGNKSVDIGKLNKACLVGYWLRFDDFNKPEFADAQYYMPTKSEWVIEPNNQVIWKSHFEMMIAISEQLLQERAPLIWLKKSDTEFEKLFVVWW